ncbi:hypothetical protein L596_009922 [Steinernema carpocapsae]|uniref:UPAR/Ly6 domain-containing protein n=1 Tax=Steinernema carpocapsae TaxID=34508 RepID=A0A4U5PHK0_STECR|nr:hypothetical protein L596_009922 [Steinernema carpocapsae]
MLRAKLVLLLVTVSSSTAIECYIEDSVGGKDIIGRSAQPCPGITDWCGKFTFTAANGQKAITWACDLNNEYCSSIGDSCGDTTVFTDNGYVSGSLCCCNSDKCNGATTWKLALGGLSLVIARQIL